MDPPGRRLAEQLLERRERYVCIRRWPGREEPDDDRAQPREQTQRVVEVSLGDLVGDQKDPGRAEPPGVPLAAGLAPHPIALLAMNSLFKMFHWTWMLLSAPPFEQRPPRNESFVM